MSDGFGTSTSVFMVRVASSNLSAKRATRPGNVLFRAETLTSTSCPNRTEGTADSGTGRARRSLPFSERRTSGIA